MEREVHIASIVVYLQPAEERRIRAAIGSLREAEMHACDPSGKLVVTLETDGTRRTLDLMDAIRALPGVIDVALVYQHAEPHSALDQEIDP